MFGRERIIMIGNSWTELTWVAWGFLVVVVLPFLSPKPAISMIVAAVTGVEAIAFFQLSGIAAGGNLPDSFYVATVFLGGACSGFITKRRLEHISGSRSPG